MKQLPSILWSNVCKDEDDRPEDYSTEDLEKLKYHHEAGQAASLTRMHPANAAWMYHTAGGSHVLPSWSPIKYHSNLVSREAAADSLRRSPTWGKGKIYKRVCDELDRRKKEDNDE